MHQSPAVVSTLLSNFERGRFSCYLFEGRVGMVVVGNETNAAVLTLTIYYLFSPDEYALRLRSFQVSLRTGKTGTCGIGTLVILLEILHPSQATVIATDPPSR